MKKLTALLLATIMALSLLAGCSNGKTNTANTNNTTGAADTDSKSGDNNNAAIEVEIDEATGFPLSANQGYPKTDGGEITIWHVWSNQYLESYDEIAIESKMEEVTGVKTNWVTVDVGERNEKFGILLSSGDLPDLIYAQTSEYPGGISKAVEDGVFMDVTDFAQQYVPNYIALLESDPEIKKAATSDDGRLLCFYQIACTDKGIEAEKEFLGLVLRKDWLDDLGLDAPVTIDDWHTVLTKFKEEKGAEAPLMIGPKGTLINGAFTSAFGVMPEFYQENGTVKFGPAEAGYKAFVETFRQWYAEGLIDQNFMTNNVERFPGNEFTTTGITGAYTTAYSHVGKGDITLGLVTDENYELIAVPNPVLNEGDTAYALPLSAGIVCDPLYVSADSKNLEALGAWLNYMYSKEGAMLQGFGIEGIHYNLENGEVVYTDEILNKEDYTASDAFSLAVGNSRFGLSNWYGGMLYNGAEQTKEYLATEEIWTSQDMSRYISKKLTMTPEETDTFNTLYSDIQTFVDESIAQFIIGSKPMEDWDAFVQQLHDMGIDECIQIKQNALDRYNAR